LEHKHGGRLYKDVKAIFTLTEKQNLLGHEIFNIENRIVKFKEDSFHGKIVEQIRVFFLNF
jgi:hypothetical protein